MSSFTPINRQPDKMSYDSSSSSSTSDRSSSSSDDDNKNNNNNSENNTDTNAHVGRVRPWQRKALQSGRNPLPESRGDRPWLNQTPSNPRPPPSSSQPGQPSNASTSFASSFSGTGSFSSSQGPDNHSRASGTNAGQASSSSNTIVPQTYRFWTEEEMRRLITIRNGGAGWPDIFAAFPHRTPEAIKQTYHKRRYAIERQMQQEAAAAAAASSSNKDDEMPDDEPKDNDEDAET
ncbi:hypothetical protein NW762_007837 [Fusarium torreyae]|uniref:Myb-like domain-containing protein n=1 Tax=Fusarium torreyae TaxID=1237075 RepID=A0A9W8S0C2_9HYPO|nr:hypothetical protein NW762_007837 [Fusarium torreyae]